jgi:hypothetical protein
MKKGWGIILLTLSVGFLIIGVHQTMTVGVVHSYWILLISVCLLLLYKFVK